MNKTRITLAFAAGLLAATAANAGDTQLSQLLSASVVNLPVTTAPSPLSPATEAAISRQIATINVRMTATLAAPSETSAPVAAAAELASR